MMRSPGNPAKPRVVLVVEDDDAVLRLIVRHLVADGFSVLSAQGEDEAVAKVNAYPGDLPLLLTDVRLKKGNGLALARRLSASRPEMRIIFMSGFGMDGDEGLQILRRQDVFLAKPFDIGAFRKLLQEEFQAKEF